MRALYLLPSMSTSKVRASAAALTLQAGRHGADRGRRHGRLDRQPARRPAPRARIATSSADSSFMSIASWRSMAKPITTQAMVIGALTGMTTIWNGLLSTSAMPLAPSLCSDWSSRLSTSFSSAAAWPMPVR